MALSFRTNNMCVRDKIHHECKWKLRLKQTKWCFFIPTHHLQLEGRLMLGGILNIKKINGGCCCLLLERHYDPKVSCCKSHRREKLFCKEWQCSWGHRIGTQWAVAFKNSQFYKRLGCETVLYSYLEMVGAEQYNKIILPTESLFRTLALEVTKISAPCSDSIR